MAKFMNPLKNKTYRIVALTIIPLALWCSDGHCMSPEQIFTWVSMQMGIEEVYDMPVIKYVDKQRLQLVFQELSHKSYTQISSSFGRDYAEKIMGLYRDKVVGLFHPPTRVIYIGTFLTPCRRKAVLAHEITHYLQDLTGGQIHADDFAANERHAHREKVAYEIEDQFEQVYCTQDMPFDN